MSNRGQFMQVKINGEVIKKDEIKNKDGGKIFIYSLREDVTNCYNIVVTSSYYGIETLKEYHNMLLDKNCYLNVYNRLLKEYQEYSKISY